MLPLGVPIACGAAALLWRVVPPSHPESLSERFVEGSLLATVGAGLVLGVRCELGHELGRVRAVAHAAQRVLLRPLPARLDGLMIAAGQLSATRDAAIGGDLYEAVATPYGVRIVMGDVRGHGLPAIDAVAVVLGSFREAAHDEPELAGVLRRLDRSVQRYLRERARDGAFAGEPDAQSAEEFVTVLLLEIGTDGSLSTLNCGHPWPYRLGEGVRQLAYDEPLPPLGLFPLPAELPLYRAERLLPGEALFLHTDGAAEARNADGDFFALEAFLTRMNLDGPLAPAAVVASVHGELLRHTGGRIADDVALLVLRSDRPRVSAQYGEEPRRPRREPSNH
ncbi:PP2C family protein-serine/threonine phosphatase [Streptomyces albipurpureus]|uniref:Serine/threonine-protein phosphatase n=1 Tax=Streptomyces albipurpureus TaxID=2897419 RepID=A0ABT0UPN4_9ACTN|nr:PP2C family protein-serine/threonine phosphatase [Streptomyces sp. CWNU-1]MCM2390419.1 serine/threonine-protein phosphatase [Streptomyces sp. CWNU-1]